MPEHTKLQESGPAIVKARGTIIREQSKLAPPATTSVPNGPPSGYGFLFEANQQAFARWFQGITILSGEVTQFIQSRLQDDMASWSALASCKTSEEAFECQRRFAEKATAQYSEEITKLSQLMLRLATQGLELFPPEADGG